MYKEDCMHKYELDSIMLKGYSCDELENSVLCHLLCDMKYLLHFSQNSKVSSFMFYVLECQQRLTTIFVIGCFLFCRVCY